MQQLILNELSNTVILMEDSINWRKFPFLPLFWSLDRRSSLKILLNAFDKRRDWGISSSLTDQELTNKVCILLSLTTASRVSGLQHLDIRYMTKEDNNITFYFVKLHKGWHKDKPCPSLTIIGFPEDSQLCVIETLDMYLDRTKARRLGKSQLLLSFKKTI